MRGWFRKGEKVTAATARRITGISTPFGGLQWSDPGPSERETVRGFVLFLEDRRVLYNPMNLEVRSQVDRSIHEIRRQCTETLQQLGETAFGAFRATVGLQVALLAGHYDVDIEGDLASVLPQLVEDGGQ